jgi:Protein of unknown function (DUF4031)
MRHGRATGAGRPGPRAVTLLVDAAIWERRGRRFAHLVSDASYAELHAFAARLGLPPRAFHNDHYDLPADHRDEAIALGAEPVDARQLVRRLRASGLRKKPGQLRLQIGASAGLPPLPPTFGRVDGGPDEERPEDG